MNTAPHDPVRWRDSLGFWLLLALAAAALLLALALTWLVAPATSRALSTFGRTTLIESTDTMREVARELTRQSSTVLIDLIGHTATARERALHDLPLESLGGDTDAIRSLVLGEDAKRSARQRRNVEVLAGEMRRRANRDMVDRLARLASTRAARERTFVDELTRTHLLLVGATLAVLLLVLGFGLHHLVVRPTARLRRVTQRVAAGELAVDVPAAGHGELGQLTRDFAAMLAQLRSSRTELQHLADNLEAEVLRKTRDLEQSHRQLAEAERLAALGTLAGGVAHEFHNVIGGIRGCADELLHEERDPDRRETLAVITRAADRAAGIVQQLQRFARHPEPQRAPVDVAAVLADALKLCEPAARRQSVAIERELTGAGSLAGDADGLHQVFVNLFVNALQAMPDGGTLSVAARASDDEITVCVADTGPGVPEAALAHVFEPFFTTRADHPDPERKGSGLGLSVSYGIVTAHGGTIAVRNRPGGGAEFVVHLPRL